MSVDGVVVEAESCQRRFNRMVDRSGMTGMRDAMESRAARVSPSGNTDGVY